MKLITGITEEQREWVELRIAHLVSCEIVPLAEADTLATGSPPLGNGGEWNRTDAQRRAA